MPSSLNSVRVRFFRLSSSFEASRTARTRPREARAAPVPGPQFSGQPSTVPSLRPPFRAARTMAAYATMDKAPVCTAELIMLAHARLPPNQRPPCGDMHLVWLLIGKELGDQLSKRRGVRLEGLGDIILTVDGIRLVKGGNLRGARPAHPLNLAAIAKAANARGVCSSAASRDGVARTARAVINELMRLANRRRQASLSLRPVGSVVSRKARSENEEGVDLIVEDEFQCRTALAWDKNLQSTGQPFGSRVRGFRQDDRARSRATVAPPVYRGRGKAVLREEMTSVKAASLIRKRAHDRHGPDGLSIIARCLKACSGNVVDATILKNALEDAGVASTPEERNALIENDSSTRTVEKSLAFPNALSTERRMIIDEAWAELQQRHFEREKARQKGARKDGSGIEPGIVSLAVLKQRIDGDWHPAVQSGRADEEAVVTRLLAFSTSTRRRAAHVLDNNSGPRWRASRRPMRMMTPSTRPSRAAGSSRLLRNRMLLRLGKKDLLPSSRWPGLLRSLTRRRRDLLPCRSAGGTTRTTSTRGWSRASRWVCWTSSG